MLFAELEHQIHYKQAPLPFMGAKKNFIENFRRILHTKEISPDTTILDLFGGSGLLSHHLKRWYPDNEVVWNDYDNYAHRLELIPITNQIKAELESRFSFSRIESKIPDETKEQILEIITKYMQKYGEENIDFITLSASFLFSGNYAKNFKEFSKECFYNRYSAKVLVSDGYLKGVVRESGDYRDVLQKYAHKKCLLILDPPYWGTETGNYNAGIRLIEYLRLCESLRGRDFVLFSSEKSASVEVLEFLGIEHNVAKANLNLGKARI